MITNKNLLAVGVVVVCCITVVWFSTSIQGGPKTYELRPQISVPEYRTDAVRAIDAYERLMERYMDLTERNSMRIGTDLKEVMKKLDSINDKLTELSARIARIEKTFGIEQPKPPAKKKARPKAPDKKAPNESLSPW
jgi:predicted  nucleic acid-binding Zn-ribbon protein